MGGSGGGQPPWTLREIREARGLTQPALASLAGVGHITVSRIERHKNVPTPRVARRLATALDLPVEEVAELAPAAGGAVVARRVVRRRRRPPIV